MAGTVHSTSLNSFNANHELYHKVRPDFDPVFVKDFFVDLDLATGGKTILELAAGTGKFTHQITNNQLHETNHFVAVEPSQGMLTSFKKNFPDVESKLGSSYDLPLEDNSVDAVIIAQGYHWFADHKSLKELYRVLKPNGKLGLIWNFDTTSTNDNLKLTKADFRISDKDLQETKTWGDAAILAHTFDGEVPQYRKGIWRKSFEGQDYFRTQEEIERLTYNILPFPKSLVYDYWLSRSFITALPEAEKAKLKQQIEDIVAQSDESQFLDEQNIKQFLGTNYYVIPVNKQ